MHAIEIPNSNKSRFQLHEGRIVVRLDTPDKNRSMHRVACCAVVGKQNNPLYIQTFNQDDELKFHFIVHTSLDIVEERTQAREKPVSLVSRLVGLFSKKF